MLCVIRRHGVSSARIMCLLLYPTNIYLIRSLFLSMIDCSLSVIRAGEVLSTYSKLRNAAICFAMCRLSGWNNSALSGQIFMKFGIWVFFETVDKTKVWLKYKNRGYCTFRIMYIYVPFLEREKLQTTYMEKKTRILLSKHIFYQNEHLYSVTIFRNLCRLRESEKKCDRAGLATDDSMIRRMRFVCWINKAVDTHSEYDIRKKNGYTNAP
jgi:hypothetical protein